MLRSAYHYLKTILKINHSFDKAHCQVFKKNRISPTSNTASDTSPESPQNPPYSPYSHIA